jgi:hypothetical protein
MAGARYAIVLQSDSSAPFMYGWRFANRSPPWGFGRDSIRLMKCSFVLTMSLIAMALVFALLGCGASSGTPAGAVVGRAGRYDYSPSIMQTGNQLQIWWCGQGRNPQDASQDTDSILYVSIDTTTGKKTDPVVVLAETPGTWDQVFTCNPRVIRGSFVNPLDDGKTYTYAMYYVATAAPSGVDNSIGVAFSNDGIAWNKYKDPVIGSDTSAAYGVGQPAVYNIDGKSNLMLLYEHINASIEHIEATSTDGIHFSVQGTLTRNGFDPNNPAPSWGDIGYDPVTQYWYAAFNLPTRNVATTGGQPEAGQYGIQMYRIPDASLLTGATPWQLLKTIDTNSTGYEANFLAGFLKDQYGNLNVGAYPTIQLYPSTANPRPNWDDDAKALGLAAGLIQWDVGSFTWTPGNAMRTLTRYKNNHSYDTSSGYLDPGAHFAADTVLGHLYEGLHDAAVVPLFNCKNPPRDYFVSLDPLCGGSYVVGFEGYGYAKPVAGKSTVPIYSCSSASYGHFASKDAQCEGSGAGTLLGYVLP